MVYPEPERSEWFRVWFLVLAPPCPAERLSKFDSLVRGSLLLVDLGVNKRHCEPTPVDVAIPMHKRDCFVVSACAELLAMTNKKEPRGPSRQ
jgi:hypothetical protein